jgi:hypothetical protein
VLDLDQVLKEAVERGVRHPHQGGLAAPPPARR